MSELFPSQDNATLSGDEVLSAVDYRYPPDTAATLRLRGTLEALVRRPELWERLGRGDHLGAQLECEATLLQTNNITDLLVLLQSQPAHVVLIRKDSSQFALWEREGDETWLVLNAQAEVMQRINPANTAVDAPDQAIEAITLRLPSSGSNTLPTSARSYLRWLLTEAWAEVGIASLLVNGGQILLPLFSMLLYNKVINNGIYETLWALTFGMLIYIVTDAALRGVRAWAVEKLSLNLSHRDDLRLWRRLTQAGDPPVQGFATLLAHYRDLSIGREFISATYLLALADLPFLILYMLVITIIAWPLGLLTMLLVGGYMAFSALLQKHLTNASRATEKAVTAKLSLLGTLFSSLDLLRTSSRQSHLRRRWIETGADTAAIESRRRLLQSSANIAGNVMAPFTTVAVLVLGAYLVEWQMSNIGALIACSMLAGRTMAGVSSLFTVLAKWDDFQRASERFEHGLPNNKDVADSLHVSMPASSGSIEIISLGKRYEDRPPVLENISFSITGGERIAVLGKPGAGKSTLLRCLAGLSRPDNGRILFDGATLNEIRFADRSEWLAFKGQDPALFAATLADNLQAASPACLERALWLSGLDDELRSGRLTLGTRIEDQGRNLSGGQRQKLALARVFAREASIYLLDEPSAGLDPDTERQLAKRLPEALGKATVLMVTHSPALLEAVSRLIVLDNGRLVANGPKDKLIQASQPLPPSTSATA